MRLNKKAEEEASHGAVLVAVIIAIVAIFIVGSFVFKYLGVFSEKGSLEACRADIIKAWITKIPGKGTPLTAITNCPRGEVKVFKDENADQINHYIAQTIDDCMYKFDYGNKDWRESPFFTLTTAHLGCFICGQFKFEGNAKKNYNGNSFFEYAQTYKLRTGETLHQFIETTNQEAKEKKGELFVNINDEKTFDTDYTYIILWGHTNRPGWELILPEFAQKTIYLPFGYFITTSVKDVYILAWLHLAPQDKVLPYCDVLMN